VSLGVNVEDPEDITSDGTNYYVVGSQSHPKASGGAGLVRFTYDAAAKKAGDVESISGLREVLIKKVPAIAKAGSAKGADDGLNIEGLAWDPNGKRLLLGLRSPLIDNKAVVIPVTFADGKFDAASITFGEPMTVDLEGQAVRTIEYDDKTSQFLIISGATTSEKRTDFALWTWDLTGAPKKITMLDSKIKPEGVTRVTRDGEDFLFMVADAGYYQRLDAGL
jgi:hypothetical protein